MVRGRRSKTNNGFGQRRNKPFSPTAIEEPRGNDTSCPHNASWNPKPIVIGGRDIINAVVFFADGKHFVTGGQDGKIRRWRVEDSSCPEVAAPMDAESPVLDVAVSTNGPSLKLVACGTRSGGVMIWDATSEEMVMQFLAHDPRLGVNAVDFSPEGTRIASGSDDTNVFVMSHLFSELFVSLEHDDRVVAAKFSLDGQFVATATSAQSVRVYNSFNGTLVANFPIQVCSSRNRSLSWAPGDGKRLFALSREGIHCLDVILETTLSKWPIHSDDNPHCITMACNGTLIAASANSSVSFWDTKTHQQIGPIIYQSDPVWSMAISADYDVVATGEKKITLRNLRGVLPLQHSEDQVPDKGVAKVDIKDHTQPLCRHHAHAMEKIGNIEEAVRELRNELAISKCISCQNEDSLNKTIEAFRTKDEISKHEVAHLEETIRGLRHELTISRRVVDQFRSQSTNFHSREGG